MLRRTELKRGEPLKADPEKTRAWLDRTRKRLPMMSEKRKAELPVRRGVREAVFARDGFRCRIAPLLITAGFHSTSQCHGPLTPHHLKKASGGGEYTEANIVTACLFHNDLMENEPIIAEKINMVIR